MVYPINVRRITGRIDLSGTTACVMQEAMVRVENGGILLS